MIVIFTQSISQPTGINLNIHMIFIQILTTGPQGDPAAHPHAPRVKPGVCDCSVHAVRYVVHNGLIYWYILENEKL